MDHNGVNDKLRHYVASCVNIGVFTNFSVKPGLDSRSSRWAHLEYKLIPIDQSGDFKEVRRVIESNDIGGILWRYWGAPEASQELKSVSFRLAQQIQGLGIPFSENLDAVKVSQNKLASLDIFRLHSIPVPHTSNISPGMMQESALLKAYNKHKINGVVWLKSALGTRGVNVHRVNNFNQLLKISQSYQNYGLQIQQDVPPPKGWENYTIGAYVVDGKFICAVERGKRIGEPSRVEGKDEVANGRFGSLVTLSVEDIRSPVEAPKKIGLFFARVDMLMLPGGRAVVIEINDSPGTKHISSDLRKQILDQVLESFQKSLCR